MADPAVIEQVAATAADRAAALAAAEAILTGNETAFTAAVDTLGRMLRDPATGQPLTDPHVLSTAWLTIACVQVFDHAFNDSWRSPDAVTELLDLITPGCPPWAASDAALAALLTAMLAGVNHAPAEPVPGVTLRALTSAGLVILAWSQVACAVDLKTAFA